MCRLVEVLGAIEQCLGWNAPHIQAGASEGIVLLDQRSLLAQLRCADGCYIASGAAANNDDVIRFHATKVTVAGHAGT